MIPKRFEIATIFLLLAPLSAGFGLWLIFQAGILVGSNATNIITVAETGAGVFFFAVAFPFFSSLGVLASRDYSEAEKWLCWLGKLKPRMVEPRVESCQPRQVPSLCHVNSASSFHPSYSADSGNRRRQTVSSRSVLWSSGPSGTSTSLRQE